MKPWSSSTDMSWGLGDLGSEARMFTNFSRLEQRCQLIESTSTKRIPDKSAYVTQPQESQWLPDKSAQNTVKSAPIKCYMEFADSWKCYMEFAATRKAPWNDIKYEEMISAQNLARRFVLGRLCLCKIGAFVCARSQSKATCSLITSFPLPY